MSIVGCCGAQDWPTVPMMGVWWLGQWEGKVFGRGRGVGHEQEWWLAWFYYLRFVVFRCWSVRHIAKVCIVGRLCSGYHHYLSIVYNLSHHD